LSLLPLISLILQEISSQTSRDNCACDRRRLPRRGPIAGGHLFLLLLQQR